MRTLLPELVGALREAGNPQYLLVAGQLRDGEGNREEAQELFAAAVELMPDSNQAKYAFVEPWLRYLGGDQAPEEIVAVANSMTGSARAVVEASKAVARKDLQAVADLDRHLAAAVPADPWFSEAVKFRVDWRSSVSNPELTKQLSEQAWRILDLAMANRNDHEFFAMRVFSASRADRHHDVLQSARGYIKAVELVLAGLEEGYIAAPEAELDLKIRQLDAITELVVRSSAIASVTVRDELKAHLEELAERLRESVTP
jgi:hypothetical protein